MPIKRLILALLLALTTGCSHEAATVPEFTRVKKLAEAGDPGYQWGLGLMYATGQGAPKNSREAVKWWHKAAEQGVVQAQSNLGYAYANGTGTPKDEVEAAKWWRMAAEQGYPIAQRNLGRMYEVGLGLPRDDELAYAWLNLASVSDSDARGYRDDLEKRLSPEMKERAQKLSTALNKEIEDRKAQRRASPRR
jgi:TPR repeat protein